MAKKKKEKKGKKAKLLKEEKKLLKKDKKKEGGKKKKKADNKKDKKKKETSIFAKASREFSISKGTPGRKRISSIINAVGADSSLHHNAKIAVSRLRRLPTITAINDFIKGDTRATITKVAETVKKRLED